MAYQGGKAFGQLKKKQESSLDEINQILMDNKEDWGDEELSKNIWLDDEDRWDEELSETERKELLESYKKQFLEFDSDNSGDIDIMELKMMMEKVGQAKTHLELKKMISEVDRENRGAISYNDFLQMMIGEKSSVLKKILKFEVKMKEKERPKGVAPKRDLSSLP